MKFKNKLPIITIPAVASATLMPIVLTSCSSTTIMNVTSATRDIKGYTWYKIPVNRTSSNKLNIRTNTTYVIQELKSTIDNSRRILIDSYVYGQEDKKVAPSSVMYNNKALTITQVTTNLGYAYACDSEDVLPSENFEIEVKFAEKVRDCIVYFGVGPIQNN